MIKSKQKSKGGENKFDKREDVKPYWVPAGVDLDDMPTELKAAIAAVINPVYTDLVLGTRDGLEKSTGVTLCHLLYLEILDQMELGRLAHGPDFGVGGEERQEAISRHLRLVHAKLKTSGLMLRLQEFGRKYGISLGRVQQLKEPMGPLEALAELSEPWDGPEQDEEELENDQTC